MNWYELGWWENTHEFPFVSDSDELKGFEAWDLMRGEKVLDWKAEAWIQCTNPEYDGDPDDVLANHLGVPIYSFRLSHALEKAGITGIQYLPIRVLHRDGSEISGYRIANITNKAKALDLERSAYTIFEEDYFIVEDRGQIASLERAVLRKEAIAGLDICRLAEFPPYEAASERFKRIFEEARCTGYSFRKLCLS